MGKVWVLDTETKGTGANMVPLERVTDRPGANAVPGFAFPELKPPVPSPPEPKAPRRFRVVDVQTREVLAEDADARATIGALEPVRSIVDVNVWVWEPERDRWRMLTLDELRALWAYRGRLGEPTHTIPINTSRSIPKARVSRSPCHVSEGRRPKDGG